MNKYQALYNKLAIFIESKISTELIEVAHQQQNPAGNLLDLQNYIATEFPEYSTIDFEDYGLIENVIIELFNIINSSQALHDTDIDTMLFSQDNHIFLCFAAAKNKPAIATHLVGNGVDINFLSNDEGEVDADDFSLSSVLATFMTAYANSEEIFRLFINLGGKLIDDFDGTSMMHMAASAGNIELMKLLHSEFGLSYDQSAGGNETPIFRAVVHDQINVIEFLIRECSVDIDSRDDHGWALLYEAIDTKSYNAIRKLIELGADLNIASEIGSPIVRAVRKRDFEAVKLLHEAGANTSLLTNNGRNLLHIAAEAGANNIVKYFIEQNTFDINESIEIIFNPNGTITISPAITGATALHLAIMNENFETVQYLLMAGADVNKGLLLSGDTPLHLASAKSEKIFSLLFNSVDDIYQVNSYGKNIFHIAAENGDLDRVKFLLERFTFNVDMLTEAERPQLIINAPNGGGSITIDYSLRVNALNLSVKSGNTQLVKYLINQGADVTAATSDGKSLIHLAAESGRVELIEYLLTLDGIDVNQAVDQQGQYNGYTPIMFAVNHSHTELTKFLITEGADITSATSDGRGLIHLAVESGRVELIEYLLTIDGVDINQTIEQEGSWYNGCTPIIFAVRNGHIELIKLLIANGADVPTTMIDGKNLLHLAVNRGNVEVMKLLIASGADITAVTAEGASLIHLAAESGRANLIEYLLTLDGVNINQAVEQEHSWCNGYTPIMFAVNRGNVEITEFLISKGADTTKTTSDGRGLVHLAAESGRAELIEYLLTLDRVDINQAIEQVDSRYSGYTPIMFAVNRCNVEITEFLISKGADTTTVTSDGRGLMHLAAASGRVELIEYLLTLDDVDINQVVERQGQYNGYTPIMFAVRNGNIELIKFLIANGADVPTTMADGKSLLHFAVNSDNVELIKLLIAQGANATTTISDGKSLVHLAVESGRVELIEYLLTLDGININQAVEQEGSWDNGYTPIMFAVRNGNIELIKLLIANGVSVPKTMADGKSLLHFAVNSGNVELIKFLIAQGADITAATSDGRGLIHLAVESGRVELIEYLLTLDRVDINQAIEQEGSWYNGYTPIMLAVNSGNVELIKLLIANDADVTTTMSDGRSLLHIAVTHGNVELTKLLIAQGADATTTTSDGKSLIHLAVKSRRVELIEYLLTLDGVDINQAIEQEGSRYNGYTPIMFVMRLGPTRTLQNEVKMLLRLGAKITQEELNKLTRFNTLPDSMIAVLNNILLIDKAGSDKELRIEEKLRLKDIANFITENMDLLKSRIIKQVANGEISLKDLLTNEHNVYKLKLDKIEHQGLRSELSTDLEELMISCASLEKLSALDLATIFAGNFDELNKFIAKIANWETEADVSSEAKQVVEFVSNAGWAQQLSKAYDIRHSNYLLIEAMSNLLFALNDELKTIDPELYFESPISLLFAFHEVTKPLGADDDSDLSKIFNWLKKLHDDITGENKIENLLYAIINKYDVVFDNLTEQKIASIFTSGGFPEHVQTAMFDIYKMINEAHYNEALEFQACLFAENEEEVADFYQLDEDGAEINLAG